MQVLGFRENADSESRPGGGPHIDIKLNNAPNLCPNKKNLKKNFLQVKILLSSCGVCDYETLACRLYEKKANP